MLNQIDKVYKNIEDGKSGLNKGISTGLPKMDYYLGGITNSYTLVGAGPAAGKTAFALWRVYQLLLDNINNNKKNFCVYFSFEINAEMILTKLLALHVYEKYHKTINVKDLTYKKIISRTEPISEDIYNILIEERSFLEQIKKYLIIYDSGDSAASMYKKMQEVLLKLGAKTEDPQTHHITYSKKPGVGLISIIIDHIALIQRGNLTKKEAIDLCSSYLVTLKRTYGCNVLVLQQINRGASSFERKEKNSTEITLNDFKDSGDPVQDAEEVIALYYPFREKVKAYRNYDITVLNNRYRAGIILKNRLGDTEIVCHLGFYGEIGYFKELPEVTEIKNYKALTHIDWIWSDNLYKINSSAKEDIIQLNPYAGMGVLDDDDNQFSFLLNTEIEKED